MTHVSSPPLWRFGTSIYLMPLTNIVSTKTSTNTMIYPISLHKLQYFMLQLSSTLVECMQSRQADAIALQDAVAHPSVFGFCLGRNAMDGVAVMQVLLDMCCLKRWAVAGTSIDYIKFFNPIPQAVIVALALELGVDPGTCRALGAKYKQLRRAFKVAAALGSWWRTTHGILKGSPHRLCW